MSNIKILVVNDYGVFRDGVRALLAPYEEINVIGEACEGRESGNKVQSLSPDVVLMDTSLPDIDGLEAVRCIRKQSLAVKVLALVRYEDKEYVLSVIKAGVAGCISVRASSSELVTAIRTVYSGDFFLCPCAIKILIENYTRSGDTDTYDLLTPREKETLKLIAEGYRGRNIAEMLGVSVKTVYGNRARIRKRLGLRNTAELFKYAISKRLLSSEGRFPNAGVRNL